MDDLLSEPPEGVTISSGMDGLTIEAKAPQTLLRHAVSLLRDLLSLILPTAGAALGVWPLVVLFEGAGVGGIILGFALAAVFMVVGMVLGLAAAYALITGLERLLGAPQDAHVRLAEHSVTLGFREVPVASVLFVELAARVVVLEGGERVPIAPGADEAVRSWLALLLRAATDAREEGSAAEVPRALQAMQQPERGPA